MKHPAILQSLAIAAVLFANRAPRDLSSSHPTSARPINELERIIFEGEQNVVEEFCVPSAKVGFEQVGARKVYDSDYLVIMFSSLGCTYCPPAEKRFRGLALSKANLPISFGVITSYGLWRTELPLSDEKAKIDTWCEREGIIAWPDFRIYDLRSGDYVEVPLSEKNRTLSGLGEALSLLESERN